MAAVSYHKTAQLPADQERPLFEIANEIRHTWAHVSPAAEPYLHALRYLSSVNEYYGLDSATEIIDRFLANATGWRGEDARRIKAELRSLTKDRRW